MAGERREIDRPLARWSLARQFMLASLFVLLISGLVMGTWEGRQIEGSALRDNAAISSLYVDSIVSPSLQPLATQDHLTDTDTAALDRLLNSGPLRAQVVALKIWSPSGEILYSPNRALIGRQFDVDEDLRRALDGGITSQINDLDEPENIYERQHWSRLLSVYLPVRADATGRVIAVTEFYQLPDRLESEIRTAQIHSWAVVAALTAATYLLLTGIVGRGSATIRRQRRALDDRVAMLQRLLGENARLGERVRQAGVHTTTLNERALRRISADLHDGPGQVLALALMRMADRPEGEEMVVGADDHTLVQSAVRAALADIRAISAGLLLPELEGLSVRAVIERAVRDHTQRTGTVIAVTLGALPECAPPAVVIALFRTLQEALSNATRHGHGMAVSVGAWQEAGRLCLRVADRGPGVPSMIGDETSSQHHLGLAGMRERARLLGGDFVFTSVPGAGALVEARWPLTAPEELWESNIPQVTVSR